MTIDPAAARSGSVISDNPNYLAAWLCYINGVEVPILGFTVSYGVWQIPEFTIYMVPDVLIARLGYEDRVPVQIFYLDYWVNPGSPEFRLLVDGEIIARSRGTAMGQRTQSFNCLAHINVFEDLTFFFMNTVDDVVSSQSPEIQSTGLTSPGLFYPHSLFHTGLIARTETGRVENPAGQPVITAGQTTAARRLAVRRGITDVEGVDDPSTTADEPIKAPFEMVYNVIRGIIGQTVPADRKSIPAMNFFARHTRKVRLHNRFVRMPILEDISQLRDRKGVFPIFNAVRSDEALAAMQRQIAGRVANSGSVWEVLKQALSLVYMEIAMIPTAPCVQTNLEGEILRLLTSEADIVLQDVPAEPPSGTTDRANNSLNPATASGGNEPARRQQALQALEQQVRALDARVQDLQGRLNIANNAYAGLSRLAGAITDSPQNRATNRVSRELTALQAQRMTLVEQTEAARVRAAEQPVQRASDATPPPTPAPRRDIRTVHLGTAPTSPIRLAQFYVKPQFLFAITPASNVIYPSQIDDWNDDENYRNQPTRTYVNDSVMSSALRATGSQQDLLLHALTVAWPEEADAVLHRQAGGDPGAVDNASGTPTVTTTGAPSQRLTGKDLLIWPEEYYKGPKVRRFTLPSWFQFLQQMRNVPPDTSASAAAPGVAPVVTPLPGGAVPNPTFTTNRIGGGTPQNTTLTPAQQALLGATNLNITARGVAPPGLSDANHPADTWVPSARTRSIGGAVRSPYNIASQEGIDPTSKMPTGNLPRQLPIAPGVLAFRQFLLGNFGPGLRPTTAERRAGTLRPRYAAFITSVGTARPAARARFPGGRDQHHHGRALDIMITPVNRRANNVFGNPIADWLVEHATLIGIQYVLWGRYQWSSSSGRFSYYSTAHPLSDLTNWHCDHIHMELNDLACQLGTTWFTNPEAQRSTVLPAIANNPAGLPTVVVSRSNTVAGPSSRQVTRVTSTVSTGNTPTSTVPGRVIGTQAVPNLPPIPGLNTVVTGTVPAAPVAGAVEQESPESFQNLFRLYAQYEHAKGRYNERQGSLSLQFNPYLVPGFPVTIFDSMTTRLHAVAYLVNVNHSAMATGQYGTKVSVSCVRTFPEFIQDVRDDCERFAQRLVAAPAEIIDEIRNVVQKEDQAEVLYRRLFYGTDRPDALKAAFVFTEAMGYADGLDVTPVEIRETTETSATSVTTPGAPTTPAQAVTSLEARLSALTSQIETDQPRYTAMLRALENNIFGSRAEANALAERLIQARADKVRITEELRRARETATGTPPAAPQTTTTTETRRSVIHTLDPNRELSPIPGTPYYEAFDRYDTAMQLAARPICTLAQYIRFLHAGRRISDLVATADVEVGTNEFTYSLVIDRDLDTEGPDALAPHKAYTAQSYARIFRLRPGPGTPPTEGQRGYSSGTTQGPSTTREGVPADYPQTRADWDTALIAYREKIRFRVSPGS